MGLKLDDNGSVQQLCASSDTYDTIAFPSRPSLLEKVITELGRVMKEEKVHIMTATFGIVLDIQNNEFTLTGYGEYSRNGNECAVQFEKTFIIDFWRAKKYQIDIFLYDVKKLNFDYI